MIKSQETSAFSSCSESHRDPNKHPFSRGHIENLQILVSAREPKAIKNSRTKHPRTVNMLSQRVFTIVVFLTTTIIIPVSASPVDPEPSPSLPDDTTTVAGTHKRATPAFNGILPWHSRSLNTTTNTNSTDVGDPHILANNCDGHHLEPTCRNDFSANRTLCLDLLNGINGNDNQPFNKKKRAICKTNDSGQQCCISWKDKLDGGWMRDSLWEPAHAIYEKCGFHRDENDQLWVSGLMRPTPLVGKDKKCTVLCLSNRLDGCK